MTSSSDPDVNETRERIRCEALDSKLFETIHVLDEGFIRVLDYMGTDASIAEAARISYGRRNSTAVDDVQRNARLIKYLMKHDHTSPFEMNEIKLHVAAPLFVTRQWLRHRTASVNEISARYSIVKDKFYIPTADQIRAQSRTNMQGRSDRPMEHVTANFILDNFDHMAYTSYEAYEDSLAKNLTRELARCHLTANVYTEFIWKIDTHNLLRFLRLRLDETAQYEIRVYAIEILKILKLWLPLTYAAFVEYKLEAYSISKTGLEFVRKVLSTCDVRLPTCAKFNHSCPTSPLNDKEYDEIVRKIFRS